MSLADGAADVPAGLNAWQRFCPFICSFAPPKLINSLFISWLVEMAFIVIFHPLKSFFLAPSTALARTKGRHLKQTAKGGKSREEENIVQIWDIEFHSFSPRHVVA